MPFSAQELRDEILRRACSTEKFLLPLKSRMTDDEQAVGSRDGSIWI
jgi:hypothetical protein